MGAFEDFLKKQGYVKLDQYGLVLTPDDRILSTRPAVLDDGLGGKIVGWTDGDLAAAELDHWGATKRTTARRPATPTSPPAIPAAAPRPHASATPPAPPPVMSSLAVAPTIPQPVFASGTGSTKAPVVAAEPPVEEDEWEWEIAMARARAASEDVQAAAATMSTGFTAPKNPVAKAPVAAAKAAAKAAATATAAKMIEAKTDPMVSWPKTEELRPGWNDTTSESPGPQVLSPQHKALLVAKSTVPRPSPGATVIPVPALPVAERSSDVRPLAPARTRVARGTVGEDTVQTLAVTARDGSSASPANDDCTSPYVTLPPEVKDTRPTGYAGSRRVAAKHR